MDKTTIGVVISLLGIMSFIQSFAMKGTSQYVYLIMGVALVIGGIIYAKK